MSARQVAYVAVFIAVYAALGQVIKFIPNPMVPDRGMPGKRDGCSCGLAGDPACRLGIEAVRCMWISVSV